ncbi:hypothetical protein NK8_53300 (plasmid) [Caballeronia sp. NK8]|nr:hypothetical protein NK8_53300 [Caballeronia sp. NK8]
MLAQRACIDLRSQRDIGNKLLILRLLMTRPRDDHRFAHSRMTGDLRLDLTQLDTEAANLDLMIVAAKKLDIAIGTITREIARAIHACAGNERIIEEPLGSQLRPIQIPTRYPSTTDIKLTHRTRWHQLTLCVEQIDACVCYGATNRHQIRFFRKASIRRCPDSRLRRTVLVIKRYGPRQRRALPCEIRRARLTRDDDFPKLMLAARRHTVENGLTERRNTQDACDVTIPHELDDCVGVPCSVDIDEGETAPVSERPEEAGDRTVEC